MSDNRRPAYGGPQGSQQPDESTQYRGNMNTQYPGYQGRQPNVYPNENTQYARGGYPPNYPNQGPWPPYSPYGQPPVKESNNMKYLWIGLIIVLLGVIAFLVAKLVTGKDSTPPPPAPSATTVVETPKAEVQAIETPAPEPVSLSGNWTFNGKLINDNGSTDNIEISLDSDSHGNCSGYFNNYSYGLWINLSGKLTADSFNVSGYDTSAGHFWKVHCTRGSGRSYSGTIKSKAKMRLKLTSNR